MSIIQGDRPFYSHTFCEYQSQTLGQYVTHLKNKCLLQTRSANMYCSPKTNAHTFAPHRDNTKNFISYWDKSMGDLKENLKERKQT